MSSVCASPSFGFVYLLKNDLMPTVVKVGCTSRDPHERASVLSGATGVPCPFEVVLFATCQNWQRLENHVHRLLAAWRVGNREFFIADGPCKDFSAVLDAFLSVFPPDRITVLDEAFVERNASDPRPWRWSLR